MDWTYTSTPSIHLIPAAAAEKLYPAIIGLVILTYN
jgi:hypothetical protein